MLVVITSLWLAMVGVAHAQSGGVAETRLLSKSSSGSTLLLNIGDLDNVKTGDHGIILRRIRAQDVMAIRIIPVAKGRVIRSTRHRSLWYLYDVPDSTQLILRDNYLVTTESMAMNGRRTLESTRLKVIDEKKNLPANLKSKQEGDKDLLAIRKDEYESVKRTHQLGESWAKDGQLHDVDEWVSVDKAGQQKYARSLWRSPYEKDFALRKRLETFEKIVSNYLERVNDPAFNYGDFYWEQLKRGSSSQTVAKEFKENEQRALSKEAQTYRKMLEKGQAWSEDYSDEELATMMDQIGVVYEQDRRRTVATRSYNWQLLGSFGLNMLDNENRADAENSSKVKWNLEVGGEWFPAPQHVTVQKFSLWSFVRYVNDGVSVGQLNAQTLEYSLALGMTWHMLHSPFASNTNIPFLSIGVRSGVVRLTSAGEEANYSMESFPTIAGGIKYNFRSGVGLRLAASFEKLSLEQTESNQTVSALPQNEEILEGRLSFGVTKFY